MAITRGQESVFHCFGYHPFLHGVEHLDAVDGALARLDDALDGKLGVVPVGLGETGLHRLPPDAEKATQIQDALFEGQVRMAMERDIPLVLHVVGRHGRVLEVLREAGWRGSGMIHSYSGSKEVAQEYIRLGFHLSFSGSVCRPAAKKVREAVAVVPVERILVETDYPDQAPAKQSGSLNQLTGLWTVLEEVASLRKVERAELARRVEENTEALFRLDTKHALGNSAA